MARIAVGGVATVLLLLPSAASAQPDKWLPWQAGKTYYTLAGNNERPNIGDLAYAFDFQMPPGTPVLASARGKVEAVVANCAERDPRCGQSYGNNVLVCYPDGTCSRYAHLSTVAVSPGDDVAQAGVIGLSGRTGATGSIPHVQYQVEEKSAPGKAIRTSFQDGGTPKRGDYVTSQNTPAADSAAAGAVEANDPRVEPLKDEVDRLERLIEIVMLPMTLLVTVLSLGGVIGIVFSIRDQRRVSQLHELAVGSEMSAQRRTEQSFTAFLEGSQKTLNLVNDTLELAKQATESERHALERKASAGLRAVEERAEDLVLRVAKTEDFDLLLDVRENRAELDRIAADLGRLETYRQLQEEIELPPYCRFVLGIQEFLDNDTRTALRTLRASTEEAKPQLQLMSLYWSAMLHITLGEHDDARALLTRAVTESKETRIAGLEFQRLLHEVNFFDFAASRPDASPLDRYKRLAAAIKDLEKIGPELAEKTKDDDRQHPNHEMTATRANIFMWIAYDRGNLVEPLADRLARHGIDDLDALHGADPTELDDDDKMRVWAVWEAEDLYPPAEELHDEEADIDFRLRFGRVESDFALGNPHPEAYPMLERHALDHQRREHREHRHTVELAQIALISEARLLHFARPDSLAGHNAERGLREAMRELTRAVSTAPHDTVTVFSHLQRRDLKIEEFEDEAKELEKQALAEWEQKQPEKKSEGDGDGEGESQDDDGDAA